MIARLLISPDLKTRVEEIEELLKTNNLSPNHPDLLYFPYDSKLGIAEARKIKMHFTLKPYSAKGRAAVLEDASVLTIEAQNALLKTLEEPPAEAILVLGAPSESKLLPTILSRCEIIRLEPKPSNTLAYHSKYTQDLERLLNAPVEERFEYIEKLKDRKEFLQALVLYFHNQMSSDRGTYGKDQLPFLKELLQAEEWANANVNIRAILEYLMLIMPIMLIMPRKEP